MLDDIPKIDFKSEISAAGIPTTDEAIKSEWETINQNSGGLIGNSSEYSAFWHLITAIVTKPARWLIDFIADTILPNCFIATASGLFLDLHAWGLNITRKKGVKMVGNITFYRSTSSAPVTIPQDTIIQTPEINQTIYQLKVRQDTVLPIGVHSYPVECEAVEAGSGWNLSPGYYAVLVQPIQTITSVRNNDHYITTSGEDVESDDDLRLRCQNQFSSISDFHTDAAYKKIISAFAGISTKYIYFEHGAPRGAGTANALIMIDSGVPAQALIDDINNYIRSDGHHGLGDDFLCYPMPTQAFDLSPTIYIDGTLTTADQTQLETDIIDMIRCAFRENSDYDLQVTKTYPNERFSLSVLSEELHLLFAGLDSIEFHQDDIDMTGIVTLPILGTLTVTTKTT